MQPVGVTPFLKQWVNPYVHIVQDQVSSLMEHKTVVDTQQTLTTYFHDNVRWMTMSSDSWVSIRVSSNEHVYAYIFLFCCLCVVIAPILNQLMSFLFWELLIPYGSGKGGWLTRSMFQFPIWLARQISRTVVSIFATCIFMTIVLGAAYASNSVPSLPNMTFLFDLMHKR